MDFQSEVRLFCGDNLKIIREQIPNDHVQLTVTSPPYDDLRTYNGFSWDFEGLARELYRVTKPGGVLVWVVADATVEGSETGTSFRQALYFKECGFNLHDTMIYEKAGTGACGSNLAYWQTFEYMFVFSKGRPEVVNRLTQPNMSVGAKQTKGRVKADGTDKDFKHREVKAEGVRTNIWRYNVNKYGMESEWKHPAKFPFLLVRDHILSWSNPGDTVFDPFLGSGTTGKMAVLNDRHFIGCEISEEYFRTARFRITIAQAERLVSR